VLPASFAWAAFGEKNGAETEIEMRRRIEKYRKRRRIQTDPAADYNIGCILLQILFLRTGGMDSCPGLADANSSREGVFERRSSWSSNLGGSQSEAASSP
jgi:hypothetical protein